MYSKLKTPWRFVETLSIASRPSSGSYSTGNTIQVRLTFTLAVTVIGSPKLKIDLGGASGLKDAVYASGSGTKQLTFEYTVQSGDQSAAGVAVVRNSLEVPSGSEMRVSGTLLTKDRLIHVRLAPDRRHRVGSPGVALTPSPGALVSNFVAYVGSSNKRNTNFDADYAQSFTTGGASTDPGHKLTRP